MKIFILLFLFIFHTAVLFAAYEKDPIKATQTNPVPVTEELLSRESDVGPASPTFKMKDTSGFMARKLYEEESETWLEDESVETGLEEELSDEDWDHWFAESESDEQSTELFEKKELK